MYARVSTFMGKPDTIDEAVQITEDSMVPAMRQQKGFKGFLLLGDADTNKTLAITLWDSEADMVAGESSDYYREQIAKVASFVTGPPTLEHFEVHIHV